MRQLCCSLFAVVGSGFAPLHAQSFNIDIGLATTVPSPTFDGAAIQSGPWNGIGFVPLTPFALVATSGAATSVTVHTNGGNPITSTSAIPPNALQNSNIVALISDLTYPATAVGEWTFDGLLAGEYSVTTYAYASDSGTLNPTLVEVVGSPDAPMWVNLQPWVSGGLILGRTHAVHRVVVHPRSALVVRVSPNDQASANGFQIKLTDVGEPFCAGDGLDPSVTTPCPCANFGAPGRGCSSSANPAGARLGALGTLNPDTLVLMGTGMPANAACVYVQADAASDQVLGDGIGCIGGNVIRLATKTNVAGASSFPQPTDGTSVSQRGQVVPGSGVTRYYQVVYRNAAASFCPPATSNTTNGRVLIW